MMEDAEEDKGQKKQVEPKKKKKKTNADAVTQLRLCKLFSEVGNVITTTILQTSNRQHLSPLQIMNTNTHNAKYFGRLMKSGV